MFHLQIRKQLKGTSRFYGMLSRRMCDGQEWFQISKQDQKSSDWLTSKASYGDRLNLRYVVLFNLFQLLFSMQEPNMLMSSDLWMPYLNDVWQRGGRGVSQCLIKEREVAWSLYYEFWQGRGGAKIPKIQLMSFVHGPFLVSHLQIFKNNWDQRSNIRCTFKQMDMSERIGQQRTHTSN